LKFKAEATDASKYPIKPKARVMIVNALSELDAGGEYYIDRSTGLLTLIPPSGKPTLKDSDEIWVSVNDTVVSLMNKTDVTLKDLTLAYARTSAVVVSGGSGIVLENLTIHNTGGVAVDVTGSEHTVRGCSIMYTGEKTSTSASTPSEHAAPSAINRPSAMNRCRHACSPHTLEDYEIPFLSSLDDHSLSQLFRHETADAKKRFRQGWVRCL
jgi:hypothetical protein